MGLRTYLRNVHATNFLREELGSLNYLYPVANLCWLGNCVGGKSPVYYQLTAHDLALVDVEVECKFPVQDQLTAFAQFAVQTWLAYWLVAVVVARTWLAYRLVAVVVVARTWLAYWLVAVDFVQAWLSS